ncbi:MAG: hypothetical protein DRI34_07495 [Deltaproteobacteria bacterium]|nr:MAG: hypothetical protein DRI34_07495 [Deltaproteobacteria bacterium]
MMEAGWTAVIVAGAGHGARIAGQAAALVRVAGLPPLARAVLAARHAGAGALRLVVDADGQDNEQLEARARQAWADGGDFEVVELPGGAESDAVGAARRPGDDLLVVMFADVAWDPALLKQLLGAWRELADGRRPALALVESEKEPEPVLAGPALLPAELADDLPPGLPLGRALTGWSEGERLQLLRIEGRAFAWRLRERADIVRAEKLHMRALRRPTDGIVSRWLNRPVSLWLSRHLFSKLPLTPNHITFLAAAIGWAGIVLVFLWPGYWWVLLGAALFHVSSILDGCDGEIARLRFQFSRFGEWFDNVLDEINNALFIAGIGFGVWHSGGADIYLAAALFHLLTVSLVDSATFYQLLKYRGGSGSIDNMRWFFQAPGQSGPVPRQGKRGAGPIVMQLVRRDFYILLLLLLAAANLLPVGFWITLGADTVLFVLALIQWSWQLSLKFPT